MKVRLNGEERELADGVTVGALLESMGLRRDGIILINSARSFEALGLGEFAAGFPAERLLTVPATELALEHVGRPLPNAALLGAFAALGGPIALADVLAAIEARFSAVLARGNIAAASAAHRFVQQAQRQPEEAADA